MPGELDVALKELEASTDALLQADAEDTAALRQALERRANAITRVARLLGESEGPGAAVVSLLNTALERGEQAARKVLHMKQDATAEWSRLARVLRGLRPTPDSAGPGVTFSA
jgi:hypothetical protein